MKPTHLTKLILILNLLLTSCISRYVKKETFYKETFYNYFISTHGDVVFIGQKYHYVFNDDSGEIKKFSTPEIASKLKISKISLNYNNENRIEGYVMLEMAANQKPSEKFIKDNGFVLENGVLTKQLYLRGVRYLPVPNYNYKEKFGFSKQYNTSIHYQESSTNKKIKAAITPIAFAADGTLILLGGIWFPLLIIALTDKK